MSDLISVPRLKTPFIDSIKDLCKIGLYHDALTKAETEWGAINTWHGIEKSFIAIRLYINLVLAMYYLIVLSILT